MNRALSSFIILFFLLLARPIAAQHQNAVQSPASVEGPSQSQHVLALGLGLDAGLAGLKYLRRIFSLPLTYSLGAGAAGIATTLQLQLARRQVPLSPNEESVYGSVGLFLSPWGISSTGPGAAILLDGGMQSWPAGTFPMYFDIGLGLMLRVAGLSGADGAGLNVRLQLGFAL